MDDLSYLINPQYSASHAIVQRTKQFQSEKFSASETVEMLMAEGVDFEVSKSVVSSVFGDEIRLSSNNNECEINVIPTCYEDVKPLVEKALFETYSAREFVNKIARAQNPIVACNDKTLDFLYRLAKSSQVEDNSVRQLHDFLKPYFENKILESVEISENPEYKVRVAKVIDYNIAEVEDRNSYNEVNMTQSDCTCDAYELGNYKEFGIPCEHMVAFAMKNEHVNHNRKITTAKRH